MSGFGERFRRAGYKVPKPLILLEGKPIIHHVVHMFPGETDFVFVCNEDHLDAYSLRDTLERLCPKGKIVAIKPHKLGPVYAVLKAINSIDFDKDKPVIVNYCDFTCYWDWENFKNFVVTTKCDGALPAYKGFHPHTLGTTNYAYMREENGRVFDIQEKKPYTNNRMDEFASSGTYYFSSFQLMKEAFEKTISQNLEVEGEFYVSLSYRILFSQKQKVVVYPLQHFIQWGTPEDVAEYQKWSKAFRALSTKKPSQKRSIGSVLVPMGGLGKRFQEEGYRISKPLIHVSGQPMVVQAADDLLKAKKYGFLLRKDMPELNQILSILKSKYKDLVIQVVDKVTEGQASSALIGLEAMEDEVIKDVEKTKVTEVKGAKVVQNHQKKGRIFEPLTIGVCDSGVLYSLRAFQDLLDDRNVDVIVWGVRGHLNAIRHPQMFGWIDEKGGVVQKISVKKSLGNVTLDPIVIGIFTFRKALDFKRCVNRLVKRRGLINGEFYIDSAINDAIHLGLNCVLFEVDHYLSWGTPNDLKTFEYWQSFFHKWKHHPYKIENDYRVPKNAIDQLKNKYEEYGFIS